MPPPGGPIAATWWSGMRKLYELNEWSFRKREMVGNFWHGLSNFWEGTNILYIEQLRNIELEVTEKGGVTSS